MRGWLSRLLAECVVLAAGWACSSASNVTTTSVPEGVTTSNPQPVEERAQWESLAIDNYRIVYSVHHDNGIGGIPGDGIYHVKVKDGVVIACQLEEGRPGDRCDPDMSLPVDVLFSWVDQVDPFTTVQFHPEWHIPETIVFDEPGVADEGYTIKLLEFEALDCGPKTIRGC